MIPSDAALQSMPSVTVVLVAWNSERRLPQTLLALRQQSNPPPALLVVDNASSDGTVRTVRELFPNAAVLRNFRNVGFARAANQGIKLSRTPYVLVLTPDVMLEPSALRVLLAAATFHPEAAGFTPKMLRREPDDVDAMVPPPVTTPVVDAAGLAMSRTRSAGNRGEGERDLGQYDRTEPVFGCPGACALFSRSALEAVAVNGEYFDEDFFAYKEDVDLAWRLQLGGFASWYVPSAVAYHLRRVRKPPISWGGCRAARRAMPRSLRLQSFINQHVMLVKNEQLRNFLRDAPPIIGRELQWLALSLTTEPFLWRGILRLWRMLPATLRKRRQILRQSKVRPEEIRAWFTKKLER